MGFDLAVVKDRLFILEFNGITKLFYVTENLFDLILFCCGKIFGVGTGISNVAVFIKLLNDLKALRHWHFVFFTEHILQFGKRIKLSR